MMKIGPSGGRIVQSKGTIRFDVMRPGEMDLRLFKECFERNGFPMQLEFLRWHYLSSPLNRLSVSFAKAEVSEAAEPTIAAIYATLPNKFYIDGEISVGAQSLDTLTDRDFRGLGLFINLANYTYERAISQGDKLVYGFPNANAAPGRFNRLGWRNLDPVPVLMKPLRTSYVLGRMPIIRRFAGALPDFRINVSFPRWRLPRGNWNVVDITRFDARTDEVWRSFRDATCRVAVERDQSYMNWRIFGKPDGGYVVKGLADRDGELKGYIVFKSVRLPQTSIGVVMELLYRPGDPQSGRILLDFSISELAASGCGAVGALNFSHSISHKLFRQAGFFPIPSRLASAEMHFGARSLSGDVKHIVEDRKNWYLSYCDSDTD